MGCCHKDATCTDEGDDCEWAVAGDEAEVGAKAPNVAAKVKVPSVFQAPTVQAVAICHDGGFCPDRNYPQCCAEWCCHKDATCTDEGDDCEWAVAGDDAEVGAKAPN